MNPFLKKGYLDGLSSVNKHVVNKTKAYSYFNPKLIIDEIIKNNHIFNFNLNKNVLKQLDELLADKSYDNYEKAFEIMYEFGLRLAEIFEIFENPREENILARPDWEKEHWDYFKTINRIYVAGGLVTENFSYVFNQAILDYFTIFGLKNEIVFITDSSDLAIKGLANVSSEDTLLYDFGQTNVKFGVFQNNEIILKDSIPVRFDQSDNQNEYAANCDRFIIELLKKHIQAYPNIKSIKMAISNYVHNGVINPAPWHYGILHLVDVNYQDHLEKKLGLCVDLYHDTSSMGLYFEREKNSILISLGTAFGLTFLE